MSPAAQSEKLGQKAPSQAAGMDDSLAEEATAPAAWCGTKVFLSKNPGSQNPREAAGHRAEQLLTFV